MSPTASRGSSPSSALSAERRIAIFGGTFDPIHVGHLAVARAAARRFHLDEIHFVPTGRPPHKHRSGLASYLDRYAMVALACADHPDFIASMAEAGDTQTGQQVFYSVDTVRHFKQKFRGSKSHLYFLLGADSFLQIPSWKDYETLLDQCDFIVATRPGFRVDTLRLIIPPEMLARRQSEHATLDPRAIALRRTSVYILDSVSSHVSATEVRERLDLKSAIHGLVPPRVEEYITKQALYQ